MWMLTLGIGLQLKVLSNSKSTMSLVEYGIDFVLQKPFTLRDLKNIFEEL
jgi:hypothetical protein